MKRTLSLLLAAALAFTGLLAGCNLQAGEQSADIPELHSASLQDQMEPIKDANTLILETSELEPGQILPGAAPEIESNEPPLAAAPEPEAETAEPEATPEPAVQADPEPAPDETDDALGLADQVEAPQEQPEPAAVYEHRAEGEPLTAAAELQPAVDVELFEAELLRLINEERAANGVEVLGLEENMRWAARIRAPEALESLSHTRPDGTPYYTAFDEAGFSYAGKWHGENVASIYYTHGLYDTLSAAAFMFGLLKDSPGHYSNMLSENFSQAGIGVYAVDDGEMIYIGSAQLFASL